ncbi:MAG TPA: hypothetical protein VG756_09870 [Pseudonocardiaceae bacterium]|nr:hypothetical protein [Pseudonocardiaceae bacterium]
MNRTRLGVVGSAVAALSADHDDHQVRAARRQRHQPDHQRGAGQREPVLGQ